MFKKKIRKIAVRDADKKRPLINAYNEKCFWVFNGPVLSNLKDLLRAFKAMSDSQFEHHVTPENNDFANWVQFVLLDTDCAEALRKAKTVKTSEAAVERILKEYHA